MKLYEVTAHFERVITNQSSVMYACANTMTEAEDMLRAHAIKHHWSLITHIDVRTIAEEPGKMGLANPRILLIWKP